MKRQVHSKVLSFMNGLFISVSLFVSQNSPVRATATNISIALDQPTTVIGRTVSLYIQVVNLDLDPIRATKFVCIAQGTSLKGSSISQLPSVIAPNGSFTTQQQYRAVSSGTTQIHCELTAVDTVTGVQIMQSSPTQSGQVLSETRLQFTAYASTNLLNVGQTVVVTARYGNVGNVAFTNIVISCPELGRSLVFVSGTTAQSTLPPGWTLLKQDTWRAVTSGAGPIACSIIATDSGSGAQVIIPAPTINIQVR